MMNTEAKASKTTAVARVSQDLTWDRALQILDEFEDLPIPPEFTAELDGLDSIPESMADRIQESMATPEMRERVSTDVRQAVAALRQRIANAVDKEEVLASDATAECAASLMVHHDAPYHLVATEAAKGAMPVGPRGEIERLDFGVETFRWALSGFRHEHGDQPARPSFGRDEFGLMAEYVERATSGMTEEMARRLFYPTDEPTAASLIDCVVQRVLETSNIWDWERKARVTVNNRVVREVRGVLARRHPRHEWFWLSASNAGATQSVELSQPNAVFDEVFALSPGVHTDNDALHAAHVADCDRRGESPMPREVFFMQLRKWSEGHVSACRMRGASGMKRGHAGVRVR
jgi:hypothetical protein